MFRLAHISDVHIGPLPKPSLSELASKRLIGFLNWQRGRKSVHSGDILQSLISDLQSKSPDHLIITGDLVNIALHQEFINAAGFLNSLGAPDQTSVICGNHDAYVRGAIKDAIRHWQPWMAGDDGPLTTIDDYPIMRRRGDVVLISCNSAEATPPFMATGFFRQQQAQRLAQLLEETDRQNLCRVVAIHHPPIKGSTRFHKRLIGIERFQQVIQEKGAELVLHGHTHLATRREIGGPNGKVPVICVPAASNGPGGKQPAGRYNFFEISRNSGHWSIEMEEHGIQDASANIALIARHKLA